MKKTKKILLATLAVLSIGAGALGFSACSNPAPGPQGEKGEQGIQGEQGPQGEQGSQGEQGVGIEKVGFDENGDLFITFTDGSHQTVTMPEKEEHVHTFGNWITFTQGENVTCEQRLFYRICSDCHSIEWKNGDESNHAYETETIAPTCQAQGYDIKTCTICGKTETLNYTPVSDHIWKEEYSYNNSFHWIDCQYCDETKAYAEHTHDESEYCTVCDQPVAPSEGILYDLSADKTYYEVIGYKGTATRIVIADTYNNLPVKTIYEKAFHNNDTIKSVVIGDNVTSIGYWAFYYCTSLTSVVLGDGVTSIGDDAFRSCSNLTSVVIGDSVTSIGDYAFSNCYNLTSVYITDIAAWCNISFSDDDYSNPLYYANNLYLNNELVTELIIPDGVTSIGDYAFAGCTNLTSVVIPDSVTSIGSKAFYYCRNLTSVVIPDSVTSIGYRAFYYCTSLTSVVIGDSVTSIGDDAFYNCSKLAFHEYGNAKYLGSTNNPYYALIEVTSQNYSSYEIHADTKIIADDAFYNCSRLTSIEIPDSVTSIGSYAFFSCTSLTSVYYKGTAEDWAKISIGSFNGDLTSTARYYYVEKKADVPTDGGNYWHYDENGVPTKW